MELTPEEKYLIEVIRTIKVEFGRIPLVIYIHHGKLIRVEFERVVVSKMIAT